MALPLWYDDSMAKMIYDKTIKTLFCFNLFLKLCFIFIFENLML